MKSIFTALIISSILSSIAMSAPTGEDRLKEFSYGTKLVLLKNVNINADNHAELIGRYHNEIKTNNGVTSVGRGCSLWARQTSVVERGLPAGTSLEIEFINV